MIYAVDRELILSATADTMRAAADAIAYDIFLREAAGVLGGDLELRQLMNELYACADHETPPNVDLI